MNDSQKAETSASPVERLVMLEWDCDYRPQIDDTVMFGKGYDFFGLENLAQGAKGPNGNYLIWPNSYHDGDRWTLYRDSDGAIAFEAFLSEEECKARAEEWCSDVVA